MVRSDVADRLWLLAERVRQRAPLIHNLTNRVMQHDTAAAIVAVGATQATLHTREEAPAVAAMAAALAVNPGTLDAAWLQGAHAALDAAAARATPWVLDPVAVGLTPYRTDAIRALLERGPTVLKGNASEVLTLAGEAEGGRGADSVHSVAQAVTAAQTLARRHRCVVVVTGDADCVTDGTRRVLVRNGHPLMGRMIGSGCLLTAVTACYLGVDADPFEAALAALAHFDVAGECAAERAQGPGTMPPQLIDALHHLDRRQLEARLRLDER